MSVNLIAQQFHVAPDPLADRAWYIFLISEIELRFDHRPSMDQALGPAIIDLRLATRGMLQCQTTLHLGLGNDEIRQTLDFHQIHLAVLKGAS
ncbi:hypothetical protein D3C78_1813760 [compost metagenome]